MLNVQKKNNSSLNGLNACARERVCVGGERGEGAVCVVEGGLLLERERD